jgi:hypothetical protein
MSVVESDTEKVQRVVRPAGKASGPPARFAGALTGGLLAGWGLGVVARRVSVRTGVSDEEAFGSLPGDEVIPHPMVEWTRGVTVRTTPERVWPWLVQMGYGRGGWYTPEWVDLFANRWVFGAKSRFPRSAGRLLSEYQHIAVGDLICDGPDYASYFRVQRVDPYKALVYRSIRHPLRGSPIDITDPESPRRVEQQLLDAGTYFDFTWTLVLAAASNQQTRLLVRTRAMYSPQTRRLMAVPLGWFDATYGVAMLRALARRAEGRRPSQVNDGWISLLILSCPWTPSGDDKSNLHPDLEGEWHRVRGPFDTGAADEDRRVASETSCSRKVRLTRRWPMRTTKPSILASE